MTIPLRESRGRFLQRSPESQAIFDRLSALRKELKAGDVVLADALVEKSNEPLKLEAVLRRVPYLGEAKVKRLLSICGLEGGTRLRDLTDQERQRILAYLLLRHPRISRYLVRP